VFNSPHDQIIWDVGHQAYPHKLLTGRHDRFHTVRQYQGISGFCRREESPHDIFNAGHAGTSISAGLGIAEARDQLGQDYHVVMVIGDGALTAGMAWEAMNNAGALQKNKFIVILNDNEMSISPNVGAISEHLNRIITGQVYNTMRHEMERLIEQIPGVGRLMNKAAGRIEEAVKGALVPGRIFEDLKFRYFGPIDGHNLPLLLDTLKNVKQLDGPLLLHVATTKGMGYKIAEADAVTYHGPSPFDLATGPAVCDRQRRYRGCARQRAYCVAPRYRGRACHCQLAGRIAQLLRPWRPVYDAHAFSQQRLGRLGYR
jgi:1-deoxy-D-xylulose-5-phosphate synthase